MSLMGIDIGTSGCKTAIYSESGECLASSCRSYAALIPEPGLLEMDCLIVRDAILETIKESQSEILYHSKGKKDPVKALSAGSFSEAVVPVSHAGEILGNSIGGGDNRYKISLEPLKKMNPLDLYKINPNVLSFTYTYPKMAWYRDEAPELYSKVWKFLNWSDYLVYYLTGNVGSTYSHACRTLLFNVEKEDWSDDLLRLTRIDKSVLADPVPGGFPMGSIKPEVARELGFSEEVVVVSGGHDQCLNALGAGAVNGGQSVTGIGTFECTTLVYDSLPDQELMFSLNLNIEHHVVPGKYVSLIYNQAGSLQTWFLSVFTKELIGQGLTEKEIIPMLVQETKPGPTGVIFLPTLQPTGAPYFRSGMSGTYHGLHSGTSRGDLYKALLEGESMYFLDTFEKLEKKGVFIDEIMASGGGSRSELWLQIKADLTGKPVKRTGFIDAGTVGAAILAGFASGYYSNIDEAVKSFNKETFSYNPDFKNQALYVSQLNRFKELFQLYA